MSAAARSRVVTEPLGGSALSQAVQHGTLPPDIQPWSPSNPDEWRAHAERVRASSAPHWYKALEPAIAPHGVAAERLRCVGEAGGIVVTTGQQAGLFGGPLYTLAKAITALTLADRLQEQLGIPAAPVFWGATDDADFLEASITYVADAEGLHELRFTNKPPAGTPMSRASLGDTSDLLEQLLKACGSAANAEYFEVARVAFTEERTFGDAYIRLLRDLFAPLGISVLDSSHAAYAQAARPILMQALERAPHIARTSAERAAAIRALGFEPQVEDERGLSLVAVVENGVKRRVPVDEARKVLGDSKRLASLAPNVLLRPIVEREVLPTVAYVAGPAELAYFTQSAAVAQVLGRTPPVGVPRWSCTVIEPFAAKALARLGVAYGELRDKATLERRLAVAALPASVASAWSALQDQLKQSVRTFGGAVQDASLMPPEVIEGLERSLSHKLSRAERRLLAAVKRKEERVRRDLAVAGAALFPLGQRQERTLNSIPMLTRGGPELVDDMLVAARDHVAGRLRAMPAKAVTVR